MKNERLEKRRKKISKETIDRVNESFNNTELIYCGTCKLMNDGECDSNKPCDNFDSHEQIT